MTTSVYSTNNINDDIITKALIYKIITKALIYKQLNPPLYRIYKVHSNSSIGSAFSKAVILKFNVQGKGVLSQYFLYDINNKIAKDRFYYYSEKQRKKDMKKNKMKKKKMIEKSTFIKDKEV